MKRTNQPCWPFYSQRTQLKQAMISYLVIHSTIRGVLRYSCAPSRYLAFLHWRTNSSKNLSIVFTCKECTGIGRSSNSQPEGIGKMKETSAEKTKPLIFGFNSATATAMPETRPPPPTGMRIASRWGTCSRNSIATVPCKYPNMISLMFTYVMTRRI